MFYEIVTTIGAILLYATFIAPFILAHILASVYILHRPFRNERYYNLPLEKIKGEVYSCKYFLWATRLDLNEYRISVKTTEWQLITAFITPIIIRNKEDRKNHSDLAFLKEGVNGTLYYRKDGKHNYFEDFVLDTDNE